MDIALTDLLTCPRCGPAYGLVVLPAEVRDRRIRSGVLGCANCRERYRLEEWVADLRSGEVGEVAGGPGARAPDPRSGPDREAAMRLGALLGLGESGGVVLLTGPAAMQAGLLGELLPGIRVVVIASGPERPAAGDGETVSHVRVDTVDPPGVLPFRDRSARGVVLAGRWSGLLEEGARLVAPAGRLVVESAPPEAVMRLERAGLRVLVDERGTIVAGR